MQEVSPTLQEVSPTVCCFYSCFRAKDTSQKKGNCFVLNSTSAAQSVFTLSSWQGSHPSHQDLFSLRCFRLGSLEVLSSEMIFFDSASNLGSSPSVAFLVIHYHGNSFLHQKFANGAGEWWCSEMNPAATVMLHLMHHRYCNLEMSRVGGFFFL